MGQSGRECLRARLPLRALSAGVTTPSATRRSNSGPESARVRRALRRCVHRGAARGAAPRCIAEPERPRATVFPRDGMIEWLKTRARGADRPSSTSSGHSGPKRETACAARRDDLLAGVFIEPTADQGFDSCRCCMRLKRGAAVHPRASARRTCRRQRPNGGRSADDGCPSIATAIQPHGTRSCRSPVRFGTRPVWR